MYVGTVHEFVQLTNASTAVTLSRRAVRIIRATQWDDSGAAPTNAMVELTLVTAAPNAGEIQFEGTPAAPSASLTLGSAAATGDRLWIEYEPEGAVGAAA